MSLLPKYASVQYTLGSLGGVIFERTQSQERMITAAPVVRLYPRSDFLDSYMATSLRA